MTNIHKHRTPQQILECYPHPITQPDSEEARQARVAQRFRLEFLLDPMRIIKTLGKKPASAKRREKARSALAEVERANALMWEPQNAFLAKDHALHISWLQAELGKLVV